jgi:hypothetical protein
MRTIIISLSQGITTMSIINRELDRIERLTGCRPVDWMYDIHDLAIIDNTEGGHFDFEGFVMQVSCDADHYIDFVQENYPELIVKEG